MIDPPSNFAILPARIAVVLRFGLVVTGIVVYGISAEELDRFWRNIVARPGGAMTFRFVLQPSMAGIAALRDGINHARLGRPPYLSAVIRGIEGRGSRLWEGIISTARILILSVLMDIFCQLIFLSTFHPAESVPIAILLAFVPYALLRGPIKRAASHRNGVSAHPHGRRPNVNGSHPHLTLSDWLWLHDLPILTAAARSEHDLGRWRFGAPLRRDAGRARRCGADLRCRLPHPIYDWASPIAAVDVRGRTRPR